MPAPAADLIGATLPDGFASDSGYIKARAAAPGQTSVRRLHVLGHELNGEGAIAHGKVTGLTDRCRTSGW